MSEHKFLLSVVVLASFANLGWVLIVYLLSFHAARWLVDGMDAGHVSRRRELRPAYRPALHLRAH